jgi:hypothetical protein
MIEFGPNSIRSIFILDLVVGVLKVRCLLNKQQKNKQPHSFTDRERHSSSVSDVSSTQQARSLHYSPNKNLETKSPGGLLEGSRLSPLHEGPAQSQIVTIPQQPLSARRYRLAATPLLSQHQKSPPKPSKLKIRFATESEQLHLEPTRSLDRPSSQDLIASTQLTANELRRMVVGVGGAHLLPSFNQGREAPYKKHIKDVYSDRFCYLGYNEMINNTRKVRENLKISNLLS